MPNYLMMTPVICRFEFYITDRSGRESLTSVIITYNPKWQFVIYNLRAIKLNQVIWWAQGLFVIPRESSASKFPRLYLLSSAHGDCFESYIFYSITCTDTRINVHTYGACANSTTYFYKKTPTFEIFRLNEV